jgi:hypothetical protein
MTSRKPQYRLIERLLVFVWRVTNRAGGRAHFARDVDGQMDSICFASSNGPLFPSICVILALNLPLEIAIGPPPPPKKKTNKIHKDDPFLLSIAECQYPFPYNVDYCEKRVYLHSTDEGNCDVTYFRKAHVFGVHSKAM